jgi:hypothetical protein
MAMSSRDKGKEKEIKKGIVEREVRLKQLCWKVFGDMVPEIILRLGTSNTPHIWMLQNFSKLETQIQVTLLKIIILFNVWIVW